MGSSEKYLVYVAVIFRICQVITSQPKCINLTIKHWNKEMILSWHRISYLIDTLTASNWNEQFKRKSLIVLIKMGR